MRGRATVQLCTITPVRAPGDRHEKCDSELEALVRVPAVHAVYSRSRNLQSRACNLRSVRFRRRVNDAAKRLKGSRKHMGFLRMCLYQSLTKCIKLISKTS